MIATRIEASNLGFALRASAPKLADHIAAHAAHRRASWAVMALCTPENRPHFIEALGYDPRELTPLEAAAAAQHS